MKELITIAREKLNEACRGSEDLCSVRYYLGYIQAVKDVDQKLRREGLEELEE